MAGGTKAAMLPAPLRFWGAQAWPGSGTRDQPKEQEELEGKGRASRGMGQEQ